MKESNHIEKKTVLFRRFSRKKYAAFNSMHRVVHISRLIAVYTLLVSPFRVFAQDDSIQYSRVIDLEEVEVTGQPGQALSEELPRLVSVLSFSESEPAPRQSITDLLRFAGNIDLRQRGKAGIQSDLSIRGGSFDHSLVLFNGISISDPQTGHLSLNLPVETDAVQRIEILNGSASRIYGPNAFSGVVNFITEPLAYNALILSAAAGQFNYLNNSATLHVNAGPTRNLLHYNNAFSSGFTKNTDYFKQGFFLQNNTRIGDDRLDMQWGYNSRAFGSNGFYTPRYPDQFENNKLWYVALGYKTGDRVVVHPRIYWRRHRDRWEMFRVDDDWYRISDGMSISNDTSRTTFDTSFVFTNHHINDTYGANLNLSASSSWGTSSLGFHLRSENILSTNTGHDRVLLIPVKGYPGIYYTKSATRSSFDVFFEQTLSIWRLYLSGGVLMNWNSFQPDQVCFLPGIDLRLKLADMLNFTASYNRSMGLPTFTDLFYYDPSNEGNPDLKPYTQHSLEGGLQWSNQLFRASAVAFITRGKNVIDWVWFSVEERFSPVNVREYDTKGIEFELRYSSPEGTILDRILHSARMGYTAILMDKNIPWDVRKYSNLRRKVSLMLQSNPVKNMVLAVNLSYLEREGSYIGYDFGIGEYTYTAYEPYLLTDARISYTLRRVTFFVDVNNLFNVDYIDIGSIYQPGRWISGGIRFSMDHF